MLSRDELDALLGEVRHWWGHAHTNRHSPSTRDHISGVTHKVMSGCQQGGECQDSPGGAGSRIKRDTDIPGAFLQGTWDGILQWAFQSMSRPLADTHGLFN